MNPSIRGPSTLAPLVNVHCDNSDSDIDEVDYVQQLVAEQSSDDEIGNSDSDEDPEDPDVYISPSQWTITTSSMRPV